MGFNKSKQRKEKLEKRQTANNFRCLPVGIMKDRTRAKGKNTPSQPPPYQGEEPTPSFIKIISYLLQGAKQVPSQLRARFKGRVRGARLGWGALKIISS